VRILLLLLPFLDDEKNLHTLAFQKYSKIALERISEKFILCSFLSTAVEGSLLPPGGSVPSLMADRHSHPLPYGKYAIASQDQATNATAIVDDFG
jgi:hypothetical protein